MRTSLNIREICNSIMDDCEVLARSLLSSLEFTDDYYDHHWSNIRSLSPKEEERIRQTISLIPEDCSSILDIGCGDGRITNRLFSQYKQVTGLERSSEALRYVKAEKILGSVDSLPFLNRSLDLVLCCELLEHLPFKVYSQALKEIERVTKNYIVVTVPNNEEIKQAFVTCPRCKCIFHAWRHLRSFNRESLTNLFNNFKVETVRAYRPSNKVYPLLTVMGKVAKVFRLVSAPPFPAEALCPQCGYSATYEVSSVDSDGKRSRFSFLVSPAKILAINKKSRGWLLVLYRRILK